MMTNLTLGTGEPPKQFGRYRILMKLGQGGMGVVYLAHDPELSRLVALKVPLDDGGVDPAARFRRAARAAAALHHPNICPLYEAGVIDGTPFLTMAYIDGTTLAERLRLGRLPAAEAAALVRTLALALEEAHDCGVFHRDLKPANILINRRGEPILTDFGAASLGTPAYLPPERVRDGPDADGRAADVYGLGVILYELLTGRRPFDGPAESDLFDRIVHDDPAPPSAHVPGLDPRFDAVCRTAIAWDATERYPDMAVFAAALAPFGATAHADHKDESWSLPLSMSGEIHPLTGGDKPSKSPVRPSRWPWRLVVGVAACAAVAAGAIYALTQIRYLQTTAADPSVVGGSEDSAEVHLAGARSCFDANDMDGAIREATEAVSRRPALVSALVLRGRAEYRQGADEASDAHFAEAHRRSEQGAVDAPSSARDYADRAWCYLRIDRRDEALTDCAAALRLDPGCTAAWLLSVQARHDRGRRDEEKRTCADAWNAVHPTSAEQCADLARIALTLDRPDDALRCCDEALRRDPRSSDACEARAQTWLRLGDRDHAAADFRRAAALLNPRWARDYLGRSVLRERACDPDGALADACRALELAPGLPMALRQRGAACRARKDHAGAVADCRAAAAGLTPRFAADYFDRAWLLNEVGDHGRSADDLEKALALGLRSGEVHRELAHARRNLKQYDRAAVHLDAALRLLPADALLSGERAALSLARGRPGEAVRAYSEVLAQAPDDALAYAGRGDAFFQMEEYESAVGDYTRALARTAPTDRTALADVYDRRGVALARLGRYAEAAADYSRAIDNDPADPVLYRNRAAARLRAGDDEAADADVRKAEELQATQP